jgi:peptidoglycan/LPS O-acetylase OafA/YrhL
MRLLLALIVIAVHYSQLAKLPIRLVPLDAVSVYGFFFLSGFWVCRLWDQKYSQTRAPLLTFYVSRTLRIYPLAWCSVFIAFAIVPSVTVSQFLANLVVIDQRLGSGINPPIWSLAIELQFYLLAPVLFLMLWSRVAASALLGIGVACWLIFALYGPWLYVLHFLAWFTAGALFARGETMRDVVAKVGGWSLVPLLPVLISVPIWPVRWVNDDLIRFNAIALGILATPYIAATLLKKSSRADRVLGDLAFPSYLVHWPAFALATRLVAGDLVPVLALLITALLTALIYLAIDRPIEAIRHRFVASQSQRTQALTAS